MLRIFKDKDTVVVTKGAYEQFYKPLGYQPVIENIKVEVKEKASTESKKVNNDNVFIPPDIKSTATETMQPKAINKYLSAAESYFFTNEFLVICEVKFAAIVMTKSTTTGKEYSHILFSCKHHYFTCSSA